MLIFGIVPEGKEGGAKIWLPTISSLEDVGNLTTEQDKCQMLTMVKKVRRVAGRLVYWKRQTHKTEGVFLHVCKILKTFRKRQDQE